VSNCSRAACAGCGKTVYLGSESRPAGIARCMPCRKIENAPNLKHGTSGYTRGCRCPACRRGIADANRRRYWRAKGSPAERMCMICGASFIVGIALGGRNNGAKTCSDECSAKRQIVKAHTYQARKRGAYVEQVIPSEVFERDKWRCHICRRKLSSATKWPHPRRPSIDHLVPLSLGGLHEKSNVKTACFSCNASKGNRGGNEQLLLIG
jgi:5-methylcytosine-specific restriction endonuclease McrA